jgi:hypothetical protein
MNGKQRMSSSPQCGVVEIEDLLVDASEAEVGPKIESIFAMVAASN